MKCDYCGSKNVKPVVEKDGKVYLIKCLDDKEGLCKYSTIPQLEECPVCKKEFTFLFDPGWKERVICSPCEQKAMKEYLDGPEVKEMLKETFKKPSWLAKLPKEDGWKGGYLPVPIKYKP